MKKCQVCSAPATVFLTQVINGKTTELAFCRKCAEEKGYLKPDLALSLSEALSAMGLGEVPEKKSTSHPHSLLTCSTCGMTLDDFLESRHLGCSTCYTTFVDELASYLPRHDNLPSTNQESPEILQIRNRIRLLENKLSKAVKEEDFDQAIVLKEEIDKLTQQLPR